MKPPLRKILERSYVHQLECQASTPEHKSISGNDRDDQSYPKLNQT